MFEALSGKAGLPLEIVALNAGAALHAAGVVDGIADGIGRAREAIASGRRRRRPRSSSKRRDGSGVWADGCRA